MVASPQTNTSPHPDFINAFELALDVADMLLVNTHTRVRKLDDVLKQRSKENSCQRSMGSLEKLIDSATQRGKTKSCGKTQ